MRISDWSSDVCSSDLALAADAVARGRDQRRRGHADPRPAATTGSVPRQLPFAHPPPPPPPPPHAVARQSGRVWSRARCEHHPDEPGKDVRLHLLHPPRAIELDRTGAAPPPDGDPPVSVGDAEAVQTPHDGQRPPPHTHPPE